MTFGSDPRAAGVSEESVAAHSLEPLTEGGLVEAAGPLAERF
jgi:hypothetical protein